MSLNHPSDNPVTLHENDDDSYVDPILFAEGIYASQQEYELTIDNLAAQINKGAAVLRGREAKKDSKPDIVIDEALFAYAIGQLTPFLRTVFALYHGQKRSYKQIAEQLKITPAAARSGVLKATTQVTKAIRGSGSTTEAAPAINTVSDKTDDPLKIMYLFMASQIKNSSLES